MRRTKACVLLALVGWFGASRAEAIPVDLELALVVDVSATISDADWELQRNAYRDAFQSALIQTAIDQGALGRIAASMFYFATDALMALPWTLIDTNADATAFGTAIGNLSRPGGIGGQTNIAAGVAAALATFAGNNFEGTRQTIDVSSDGMQNEGPSCAGSGETDPDCPPIVQAQRNAAALAGITINALAIPDPFYNFTGPELQAYYTANLITTGGFVVIATSASDIRGALDNKLVREITPTVPEPTSMALLGLGLLGVAGRKLRTRAK